MAISVTTGSATSVTNTSATAAATVIDSVNVTEYGFQYGLTQTPTFVTSQPSLGVVTSFSLSLSPLTQWTTYFYRAYIIDSGTTYYGAWKSFFTATDYVVLIDGLDRTADIVHRTLRIEDNINERANIASFQLIDLSSQGVPANEQEVIISSGGQKLFGGLISSIASNKRQAGIMQFAVDCVDYTRVLDRYLVAKSYEGMSDQEIIADLVATYAGDEGVTTYGVIEGVEIDQISFNYLQLSECIQKVAQITGRFWYIDYDKDVKYMTYNDESAPFNISSSNNEYIDLSITKDNNNIKNRVYVRGSTELSDPTTLTFEADGQQRAFFLPDKPHNFSMTQGGVSKTVGIKNIDDPADFDYLLNFQEKYVECGSGTVTPAAGTDMAFTYQYDIPILVAVEDFDSINDFGVFEFLIIDQTITTTQAARDRAAAELIDYANSVVDGSFETYTNGFRSGQTININLSDFGLNDDYFVQRVILRSLGGGEYVYDVSIASAKTLGIIRFLIDLLERSHNKVSLNPDEVVDELFNLTDTLDSVLDSLVIDSAGPYSVWSESPAALGLGRGQWDLAQWK